MNNKKILTIDKNCVFKSKIEAKDEFKNSFFIDAYEHADRCLSDIENFEYNLENDSNDFNNIIAFVGDRGSGKTSTMKSFRNSLKNKGNYTVLDTVDPMLFSNKESIIEIIVGLMFNKFKNEKLDDNLMKKKDLAKKFEKVYKDIKIINTSKGDILEQSYDNLEALIDLSSAVSLKEDMNALIKKYIEYMNIRSETKNKFLVISIDDLDMNFKVGEKMLEDIRKYLILPNVVILMAIRFEQLEEVIGQKFSNDLKGNLELAKLTKKESDFVEGIEDKSEKYLEKLIPFSRRVCMPRLSINGIELKITGFNNILEDKEKKSISSIINYNLNNKLGYVIITENHYKAIIPQNLRLFIDFIVMLDSMKSDNKEKNILIFKTYIRDVLISNIKDMEKRKYLIDILECNFKKLNRKSLNFLNRCITDSPSINGFIMERRKWIQYNQVNINEERIEYGDIVTWVTMAQLNEDNSQEIFKCIYTLRLLEKIKNNPIDLFKQTGFNFTGEFFQVKENKRTIGIMNEFKLNGSFKENFNKYDFRFGVFDIIFNVKNNKFDRMDRYNKLLRREEKEYLTDDEYTNFSNFELNSLNMVSYCMYKDILKKYTDRYQKYLNSSKSSQLKYLKNELEDIDDNDDFGNIDMQYSYIINIDFWMQILKVLDTKLQSYNGQEPFENMVRNLDDVNEIFKILSSLYNIKLDDSSIDKLIIQNEEKEKFKKFIIDKKDILSNKEIILLDEDAYENIKYNIKKLKDYMYSKKEATGLRMIKATVDKFIESLEEEQSKRNTQYHGYLNEIKEEVNQVNRKKEYEGSIGNIEIIGNIIRIVDDFDRYIEEMKQNNSIS
ncbi:KAP family NTPase [Clostridium sp. LY3-2]|uniref:KAP family NTPase n=1 Tax=Clostridium sp. LY3-2 TaxID=2942482 RepID=UPI0021535664|nr:KAP family NTPase [Clostridium sp. LY3-2]MCR6514458.1 KAP family NTPase [Clostridium sp. LY3-2]